MRASRFGKSHPDSPRGGATKDKDLQGIQMLNVGSLPTDVQRRINKALKAGRYAIAERIFQENRPPIARHLSARGVSGTFFPGWTDPANSPTAAKKAERQIAAAKARESAIAQAASDVLANVDGGSEI